MAGVPLIPLGMHVTYWDQLGWRDPASLQAATDRQQAYGHVFGPDSLYTPQAVIDGRTQVIGSAEAGIRRAVADAARQPHAEMTVRASVNGSTLTADVSVAEVPALSHLLSRAARPSARSSPAIASRSCGSPGPISAFSRQESV